VTSSISFTRGWIRTREIGTQRCGDSERALSWQAHEHWANFVLMV